MGCDQNVQTKQTLPLPSCFGHGVLCRSISKLGQPGIGCVRPKALVFTCLEKEKHLDQEVFLSLDAHPSLGLSFLISSVQGGDSRSQEVQLWEVVGRRHYFSSGVLTW